MNELTHIEASQGNYYIHTAVRVLLPVLAIVGLAAIGSYALAALLLLALISVGQ